MNKVENGSYSSRVRYLRHQHMISREIESYQEVLRETANGNYNGVITVAGRKFIEVQLDSMLDWFLSSERIENNFEALARCIDEWNESLWEFFQEQSAYAPEDIAEAQREFQQFLEMEKYLFG